MLDYGHICNKGHVLRCSAYNREALIRGRHIFDLSVNGEGLIRECAYFLSKCKNILQELLDSIL